MADWYASSASHAAVPQWAATTAYTVGQFVRALATPAVGAQYVHRCTTAGTTAGTEPAWNPNNNGTTSSGTAVFTNVTGQSAYGWSAAAGNLYTFALANTGRPAPADRVFASSDHTETTAGGIYNLCAAGWGGVSIISVNRAGSVPPVAADVLAGATLTLTAASSFTFDATTPIFYQGFTFNLAATAITFNASGARALHFKDCAFVMTNASFSRVVAGGPVDVIWENTTYRVTHASSLIQSSAYSFDLTWINTPSAIQGGTVPASLVNAAGGSAGARFTFRGVDLSAITGTLFAAPGINTQIKMLLDSCRIASGVTRMYTPGSASPSGDIVELVNCFDGTNVINERHRSAGALTTERTTTMAGGATDASGAFSFKLVSSSRSDRLVEALDSFYFDVEYLTTGASKTATVEIISSGTLNDNDAFLTLEYLGTSGSTLAKYASSKPSSLSSSALPTSSVTWNSPPGTPVKQYLRVTFTPQTAGRVRGRVHLGKPSTTIWVNPQIVIA